MPADVFELAYLREALIIGFDHDPTPIVPGDYWEIIKEDFPKLRRQHVYEALEALFEEGQVDRDMMYDAKCGAQVWHYFGLDWDGKKSPDGEGQE